MSIHLRVLAINVDIELRADSTASIKTGTPIQFSMFVILRRIGKNLKLSSIIGNVIAERTTTSKIANEVINIINDILKAIFTATLYEFQKAKSTKREPNTKLGDIDKSC